MLKWPLGRSYAENATTKRTFNEHHSYIFLQLSTLRGEESMHLYSQSQEINGKGVIVMNSFFYNLSNYITKYLH